MFLRFGPLNSAMTNGFTAQEHWDVTCMFDVQAWQAVDRLGEEFDGCI